MTTVVLLSARLGAVLPAAAVGPLRTATAVVATPDVTDPASWGAVPLDGDPPAGSVVLTTDPAHPLVAAADAVITTPEPTGAALLDAVAVMDRLRSPGGCPWDAEQTHDSLLQYLVEEAYELYEAIEDGDRTAMREELGDVLLQVLFHARVAAEDAASFDVDDVAGDLVAKLVGRHPHVFAGSERIDTAERQEHRWEELKRAEKQRESSVDGVPMGQPAVALAAKLTSRTARAGFPAELLPSGPGVGEELFALAARAKLAGVDPEAELRTAARRFADRVRAAQRAATAEGADAHALDGDAWRAAWTAQESSVVHESSVVQASSVVQESRALPQ
ncbi:nucleoside triphosphate pyrophosphohydrolase [Pseudonocardia sulfidoxydans NBRC 16205]|uniref:Nucleoside triphosphate pyrophosphohydrolase n=1 Tax=Pseudonocardia sulfidoxydans NBRC 16205 TaxID=1223511 RepID=A0A511DFG9_9PSEU|nr:MazG family protein [Pseudonocardia sulfidoxydans]GEL23539.1 nucleoside triphosphate pyrophosphohydrolase [Pseudonocardia sulfidoxydans NBRC 16205]